jgi:hypothetical protein
MPRTRIVLTIAAALVVAVGCSGPGPVAPDGGAAAPVGAAPAGAAGQADVRPAIARPALLADLASVELREPPLTNAGPVPVFAWTAVDGAATYRLTVLGPDGPRWGWEGPETSIRYGAVADGQRGPVIVPGSWWSVAALAADGELLAASDLRPVSPTDDPGPEPVWATSAGAAASAPTSASGGPADPATEPAPAAAGPVTTETVQPCSLLTNAQLVDVIGGEWSEPEESLYPHGKGGSCSWTFAASPYGGGVSISISRVEAYDPAGWNGESDPLLDGIGDEAYLTRSGMDRKVGFRRGEVSVLVSFDYGEIDFERYAAVARLVDAALGS